MISLQAQPQSAILPILALIIVSLTIIWILNKDRINVKTPKKLWLLRSYIKFLNFFVALILIGYIGFSIYNLFGSGSTILSFLIGAGGVYIVLVSLSVLLVAQTIMLFIGIHDNVDDIRKKTLDPEFMVDLTAEKQKDQSNALNSLFLLVVICLAILCSILNMTVGVEVKNKRESDSSQNNIFDEEKLKKDILTEQERKEKLYSNFLGFWEYDNGNGWEFTLEIREDYKVLYLETRQQDGHEILQPRIPGGSTNNSIYLDFNGREYGGEFPQNCKTNVGVLDYLNEDYINFRVTGDDPCGVLNDNGGIGVFKLGNVLKLKRFSYK